MGWNFNPSSGNLNTEEMKISTLRGYLERRAALGDGSPLPVSWPPQTGFSIYHAWVSPQQLIRLRDPINEDHPTTDAGFAEILRGVNEASRVKLVKPTQPISDATGVIIHSIIEFLDSSVYPAFFGGETAQPRRISGDWDGVSEPTEHGYPQEGDIVGPWVVEDCQAFMSAIEATAPTSYVGFTLTATGGHADFVEGTWEWPVASLPSRFPPAPLAGTIHVIVQFTDELSNAGYLQLASQSFLAYGSAGGAYSVADYGGDPEGDSRIDGFGAWFDGWAFTES
jgi:hypothetical protein